MHLNCPFGKASSLSEQRRHALQRLLCSPLPVLEVELLSEAPLYFFVGNGLTL